ncbi:MAG: hypothetical protein R3B69_00495 [Candidatus Paceibacterota bacterium]
MVVKKETAEALQVVEKQFVNMHKVLEKEAKNMAASRRTKKLTKAETSLIESVRMGLADAEKTIKRR